MNLAGRSFLALLLCLGLLLPKVGTALSLLVPGAAQTIVICSVNGLTTIQLGPDGAPVSESEITEEPCMMGNALIVEAQLHVFWLTLSYDFNTTVALHSQSHPTLTLYDRRKPARGPPFLIV